jgi:hypothetical protein
MEIDETSYQTPKLAANLAIDELAAEIVAAAGRLSAATCAWLLTVAKFDAADGHERVGFASTAHWLAFACSLSHRTALDHVRVAWALADHEALAREMGAGRLSYSQVRAIARVARPTEHQLVDELIEVARYGTVAQLETIVRGLRTVDDNERGVSQPEREYLRHHWTDASLWQLSARLDPERGAVVTSALETIAAHEELSPAEALVRLAEIGLAAVSDAAKMPRNLRGHERAAVLIHLDASRLPATTKPDGEKAPPVDADIAAAQPHSTEPARAAEPSRSAEPARSAEHARPYARLANGPGLPDRVVERLLCEGRVRTVLLDGSNPLDVGRTRRLITERQYRALMVRHHGHCAVPGCANTKKLDGHHVIHWIHGGRTDLSNLILLCEPHHLAHHNGEFTVTASGKGRFTFIRKNGMPMMPPPSEADHSDAVRQLRERHATVEPTAATTQWDGQRLDPDYAISVLAHRRESAGRLTPSRREDATR